ncbi:hypothetical protein GOODEAATRI_014839 [Goodea atripinnis]|uniref:RETREG1-3/ARL6IP-like N-terminal reticulon-homology domain-containing protein n=1 Tax=Goodea atripinnis TaxID=208336 RepID=A0ABV0MV21_9TELE
MCSGCFVLSLVGHYVPGIMISYIIALSVLLWPLVVYHELIQRMYTGLEPILMKLDYSMKADTEHRKHDKRSEYLDQQSFHSDPEEAYLRDLPEFPSVEEFPSIEHSLLHFPLRGPGQGDGAQAQSEKEPLSPATLLIQHLASPLHFVNTHFNGHGRPPGGEEGALPSMGVREESQIGEQKAAAVNQGTQRSLEALSEEIVSTAISTVVQNTLSAMLRSSEASEEPTLAEFLPTETLPGALESPTQSSDTADTTVGALEPDRDLEEGATTESGTGEEYPDDTLVPTEEEDFELLDQSELEQVDEGLDREVGEAAPAPDAPQQPQS